MKIFWFVVLLAAGALAQSSQPWSVVASGSSLPANVPRPGYLFLKYNIGVDSLLYASNGVAWVLVGPVSAGGSSGWQDDGANVRLVDVSDEVVIGATTPVESAKLTIDGEADQNQFLVQGHSTQTSNLVEWQNSTPTDLMTFSNAGLMSIISTGNISVPGAGTNSQHFGLNSASAGLTATAVGNGAAASGAEAVAIGQGVVASTESVIIGQGMSGSGTQVVMIGSSAGQQSGTRCTVIGQNAATSSITDAVVVGQNAIAGVATSVAIGAQSRTANGGNGIAIGYQSLADGNGPVSIGRQATSGVGGSYSITIGEAANSAGNSQCVTLGHNATNFAVGTFVCGANAFDINTVLFGSGNTDATPLPLTYRATNASGTNIAGVNWTFIASRGTGTGTSGDFFWQGSVPTGSGTSLQAAVQRMSLQDDALLTLGISGQGANSILRITATDGDQWDATTNTSDQGLFANAAGGYSFDGNTGVGTTVFGASATNEIAIGNGTAASSQPIDMVQLQSSDFAAGDARLYVWGESGDKIAIGNDQIVFDAEETNMATLKYESLTADQEWTFTNRTAEVRLGLDAYKTADEDVLDSTTPQNDNQLTESLLASSTYKFEIEGFYTTASANAGIKVELSGTVGVTSLKANVHLYDDANDNFDVVARVTALDSPAGTDETGDNHFTITGTIETSTAGTFLLQWAQNTADAVNATTVQRNSSMILTRL